MPDPEVLKAQLLEDMPDAEVRVQDTKGTGDHFAVEVASDAFAGLSLVEQHRKVYASLQRLLDDGSIHALSIKTRTREAENVER